MPSVTLRIADEWRTSGYVASDGTQAARDARDRLYRLLSSPDTPNLVEEPRPLPSTHASVWLSESAVRRLAEITELDLSTGAAANALLLRDFQAWKDEQRRAREEALAQQRPVEPDELQAMGLQSRPEQQLMLRSLRELMEPTPDDRSRVLFLEAGTGVGKTLAYLAHAVSFLAPQPGRRAWVAAPSFALLRQVESEVHGKLLSADLTQQQQAVLKTRCMLAGQAEWVSATALDALLEAQDEDAIPAQQRQAIEQWCAQELSRNAQGTISGEEPPPWSMDSLLREVPEFAFADDVGVDKRLSDEDPGHLAYTRQFERARNAELVLCTHMMLAHLLKLRFAAVSRVLRSDGEYSARMRQWTLDRSEDPEGSPRFLDMYTALIEEMAREHPEDAELHRLPDLDLLIIDEAHVFDDAMARAFSVDQSVLSMLQHARRLAHLHWRTLRPDSVALLDGVFRRLQEVGRTDGVELGGHKALEPATLASVIEALKSAIEPRPGATKAAVSSMRSEPSYRRLSWMASSMERFAHLRQKSSRTGAYLHWSPRRNYPRLLLGMNRLDSEFSYLWTVVARRTALVSGTLYEHNPTPQLLTMQRALAVHRSQIMAMAPIHPPWSVSPVQALVIGDAESIEGGKRFRRPMAKDAQDDQTRREALRAAWLQDVADYIVRARCSAQGGMMVLGSAYADVIDIGATLAAAAPEQAHLVLVQRPGVKLAGLREAFLAASSGGQGPKGHPVLLAVGGAWTGFDLHDPGNENALTDLVILNAPFGAAGSTVAQLHRQERGLGYFDVTFQANLLVRQAAGRLVRAPDTPRNRRLHWIDGRIHDEKMRAMFSAITRFLQRYSVERGGAGMRVVF